MQHIEMQYTCCQLALVSKLLVEPLHHTGTLQPAALPVRIAQLISYFILIIRPTLAIS